MTRLTWLGESPQVFAAMQTEENPDDRDFFLGVHFVNLGKVFPCDKSRLRNVIKRALYSSKTKKSGMQVLVWSLPCGTPRGTFVATRRRQNPKHTRQDQVVVSHSNYYVKNCYCVQRVQPLALKGKNARRAKTEPLPKISEPPANSSKRVFRNEILPHRTHSNSERTEHSFSSAAELGL